MQVSVLSGGAAQGLLEALADEFMRQTGYTIAGSFGAVGAMREKLLAGAPADLLILTSAMIADLARQGRLHAAASKDIGIVADGGGRAAGDPAPKVDTPDGLPAPCAPPPASTFPIRNGPPPAFTSPRCSPSLASAGPRSPKKRRSMPMARRRCTRWRGPAAGRARLHPGHGNLEHAGREADRAAAARRSHSPPSIRSASARARRRRGRRARW